MSDLESELTKARLAGHAPVPHNIVKRNSSHRRNTRNQRQAPAPSSSNTPSRHTNPVPQPPASGDVPAPVSPLSYRLIWGTKSSCTEGVILKALAPLLGRDECKQVLVVRSNRRTERRKWWLTVKAPKLIIEMIADAWPALEAKTSWRLQTSLRQQPNVNKVPPAGSSSTVAEKDTAHPPDRPLPRRQHGIPRHAAADSPAV